MIEPRQRIEFMAVDCLTQVAQDLAKTLSICHLTLRQRAALRRLVKMNILLIEDDAKTVEFLRARLEPEGYAVVVAQDGRAGLITAASGSFALLIIDRLLPGLDGLALVRMLRGANIQTPILFLTALGGIDDRVEGLRAGGDDYMVKPFAVAELSARVAALIRRRPLSAKPTVLRIADLELDRLSHNVTRAGKRIELKPREFQLLEYLMLHENQVVTRTMLLEAVWDFHFVPKTMVLESHISRLRSKLDRGFSMELIQTHRGSGYRISANA